MTSPTSTSKTSSRSHRTPRGFTLVELLVVVVVVALISATVLVRWSGVHHRAVAESTLQRWESLDRHLRQQARHRGRPCTLQMDVASNRYRKRYQLQGDFTPWESLGSGVELLEVYLSDDRGRENQVEVPFDRMGVSPTYGVHLRCPDGRELRLLLAGVSGQLTQIESAGQMKDAFESIAAH